MYEVVKRVYTENLPQILAATLILWFPCATVPRTSVILQVSLFFPLSFLYLCVCSHFGTIHMQCEYKK